jgi:hypothetical protein
MKKVFIAVGLFIIILIGIAAFVFVKYPEKISPLLNLFNPTTPGSWKFQKTIKQPIVATSGKDKDITLGNLATEKISVDIPKGSFDADTKITLTNPREVAPIVPSEIQTIGAPIEIDASKPVRLNEKTIITFGFDKTKLPENTKAYQLRVAYYNGKKWDYIKPSKVDMNAGTMTFGTYHFSTYGAGKTSDSQATQSWIHTQAIANQINGSPNAFSDQVTGQMIKMTLLKMGINDPAMMQKVQSSMMQDPNYKKIASSYEKDNNSQAAKEIASIMGKKIAEEVPKQFFEDAKKKYLAGESAGDTAAIAQAAGFAVEGQYTDAAKIIGEQIADKFLITTAGKIAIVVINSQIANWKDSEIEAAYVAFNQGSNAKFYGYNVDKGDFNAVWDQMRGIRRQLEIEAINAENTARREAGMPELTDSQKDLVRENIKESYQAQFALRQDKEAELAKEEERLKKIMAAFDKAGFLGITPPAGLDKGLDLDNKLDILSHFASKMMQDTGRMDVTDKTGLLVDGKISLDDLVQGARYYFASDTEKGKADYAKFLQDRFGINPFPKLSDIAGAWNGTLTITNVEISDDLKKQAAEGKKDDNGCDFSIDPATLIGKQNPFAFTLNPTGDKAGNMVFGSKGSSDQTIPFTYENGTIKATMSQKGAVATIILTITKDKDNSDYSAKGSLNATYAEGKVKLTASLNAVKGAAPDISPTPEVQTSPITTPQTSTSPATKTQPTVNPTQKP